MWAALIRSSGGDNNIALLSFRTNSDESHYLGNGTSNHRNEKTKTLCNRKYPPKPRKIHLRNHFWPLESGFLAIATYKTRVFSKSPKVMIFSKPVPNYPHFPPKYG